MVLIELKDLKEINKIRVTRPNQSEKVEVMLTMLVIAARYGDQPSLDLTDFTSGYKSNIVTFNVKPGSDASQHFKDLKKLYNIENDPSKLFNREKTKTYFYENGYQVYLNVIAEAYNGVSEVVFKLKGFKIINKDPKMIFKLGSVQHVKLLSLVKEVESRKHSPVWKNEDEINRIIKVIRRDTGDQDKHALKKQKIDEDVQATQDQTQPSQVVSSSIPSIASNPLFQKPTEDFDAPMPFTQMQQEILNDSDYAQEDIPAKKPESQVIKSEEEPDERAGSIILKSGDSVYDDFSVKEEPVEFEQVIRANGNEIIEVSEGSDGDDEEEEAGERDKRSTREHEGVQRVNSTGSFTQRVEPQQAEKISEVEVVYEAVEEQEQPQEVEEQQGSGSTEADYGGNLDGIAQIMETGIEIGDKYSFSGYVLGVEPTNLQVIGKPFGDLIKTTNFKIYISNVSSSDLQVFKINKNCICLEFKSKEQILTFFGYDSIEDAYEEQDKIQKKLEALLKLDERIDMSIHRMKYHLSLGGQVVWACHDSIDDWLKKER